MNLANLGGGGGGGGGGRGEETNEQLKCLCFSVASMHLINDAQLNLTSAYKLFGSRLLLIICFYTTKTRFPLLILSFSKLSTSYSYFRIVIKL